MTLMSIKGTSEQAQEYLDSINRYLSKDLRELNRRQQNEILRIYSQAYQDQVEKVLKKAKTSGKIDKITIAYANQIYQKLDETCTKYNQQVAQDIAELQGQLMQVYASNGGNRALLNRIGRSVNIVAEDTIKQMLRGNIYSDNVGLSDRLWHIANKSGDKLNTAIHSCLAQGMGAADMSKVISEWAKGGHRTWDRRKVREKLGDGYARSYGRSGLDYEALRLARTTITHQAQISTLQSQKVNPYMQGVKWHSDHQAGRTCQECIDRDGTVYNNKDVPLDHPNGMCWLEPIYMINGKEATPEEIARDLAAWGRGEPNSGTMNLIPDYADIAPKMISVAKAAEKVVNKVEEVVEGLYTRTEREQKYKEMESMLRERIYDNPDGYTPQGVIEQLKQAPIKVQDMYLSIGDFKLTTSDKGAYFSPADNYIHMNLLDKDNDRLKFGKNHKYDIMFHEWGHLIDHQWNGLDNKYRSFKGVRLPSSVSHDRGLAKSFEKDMENWQKKWVKEHYKGKRKFEDTPKPLRHNKYAEFLNNNEEFTIALQDAARGLSKGAIRTQWGHSASYYTAYSKYGKITETDSAELRVSSELWAEISSGMTQPETRKFLEEHFPKTVKEYNRLLDIILDNFKLKGGLF